MVNDILVRKLIILIILLKCILIMKKNKYIEIPFQLNPIGHLQVAVNIDGIKASFLIDTGASNTVMDIGFANSNHLEFSVIDMQGGGVGTSEMMLYHRKINTFRIKDFNIDSFDLYATDFQHIKDSLAKKGITEVCHGVIGADILIKYKAKINYKKKILSLRK